MYKPQDVIELEKLMIEGVLTAQDFRNLFHPTSRKLHGRDDQTLLPSLSRDVEPPAS